MLNLNSTSKRGETGEKCQFVSQPLREHELLGLPKSTEKKGQQPMRMKDVLGPVEWEKARQPFYNERRTIIPDTLNNTRRKLYENSVYQTTLGACGDETREDIHVSGLSKSEGNINNNGVGRPRAQPENMKRLMESWEEMQIVKRSSRAVSQPLREHELLGLPKSSGKKGLQPMRMKEVLGPVEWEKARQPVYDQRRTIMPDTLNNLRRKLCENSGHQTTADACGDKTRDDIHISGSSKSEGKLNNGFRRPENMKRLMESLEKMQTVERSTHSTKIVGIRNQKVRRKLYNHLPFSPKPVAKNKPIARTSEIKTQKSFIVDVKTASTSNAPSRRSRLVPPNAIRDKYIRQQDVITEESTLSIENGSMNSTTIQSDEKIHSNDDKNKREDTKSEASKLSNSSILKYESAKSEGKTIQNEIVRPSVIMGVSAKKLQKEQSPKSDDNEKMNDSKSYGLLKELNRNTSLCGEKLDAMDKASDDNLDNISHCNHSESFCHILPQNSFLKSTIPTKNSLMSVDSQTIQWMHANLKLQVQSTEEQLFSMKRLLKTLEDLIEDQDKEGIQETQSPFETEDISAGKICDVELKVVEEDVTNEKAGESSCKIPTVGEESKRIEFKVILSSSSNQGSSSEPESSPLSRNIDDQDKENKKSVEKPRRRSARLAEKMLQSPKSLTDSFSSIENELNIVHVKAKKDTPVKTKSGSNIDPRCRRSVREYMALKSSMNFLATPDVKGSKAAIEEKCTPSRVRSTRRDLSRKLLNELEDLYAESPM